MRFKNPNYSARSRERKEAPYKAKLALDWEEVVHLAHEVLMDNIHPHQSEDVISSPAKRRYKAKILAEMIEHNHILWEPMMKELRMLWSDTQIQRLINCMDEFHCTKDWEIPAERYAADAKAKQYAKDHPGSGTHITHCCIHHGCKYGDEDCPVAQGKVRQEFPCEQCSWEEDEERERNAR